MRLAHLTTSLSRISPKLVYLSAYIPGARSTVPSLVDCGGTLNFIHEKTVDVLGLETHPCPQTKVLVADGRALIHSNREVTRKFTISGVHFTEDFLVAPIGIHSIILGMPWLEKINPLINWKTKLVQFPYPHSSFVWPDNSTSSIDNPTTSIDNPTSSTDNPTSSTDNPITSIDNPTSSFDGPVETPKQVKKEPRPFYAPKPISKPPQVRLTTKIGQNDQIYTLQVDEIVPLHQLANTYEPPLPIIPEEYQDLAEVFSKEKAHELPPHRGHLDHHINLEPGSKPTYGPIYNLSETELGVLQ